ncbi:MAG: hypothetical protein PVH30_01575 [Desulfobacterales bacterium]|jgi:hypothetical protein
MKEKRNLHLKVQELCDCYSTTDPLKEMSNLPSDADKEEAALKWLALTALHGINNNAKEITISRNPDGSVRVVAEYRETELPSPGSEVGQNIFSAVRDITHIEGDKGKTQLALGMRDSSVDLQVKVKTKDDKEKITIKFG